LNEKEEDRRRETEDGRQAAISSISFKDGRPKTEEGRQETEGRRQAAIPSIINHQSSIINYIYGPWFKRKI
jgi:hypothetical protein